MFTCTDRNLSRIRSFKKHCSRQSLDFEKLIGCDESLAPLVNQCRLPYRIPLPVFLTSIWPYGSRRSFLAQLMYEYARNQGLIQEDKKFLIVNCSEYANNPELLTANLFGRQRSLYRCR
ncbi:MAG: hypothetical protein ACLT16_10750 [[Clostridium] innocuum]